MRETFILLSLLFITSCASTIRMKYEATIIDDLFNSAQFEFYKSYPDKEPTPEVLALDAKKKLNEIFGDNNFRHNNIKISTYGNSELPEDYNFPIGKPLINYSPFTYKERIQEKKSSKNKQ
ncbi:MAG: hypothetical protein HN576_11130 [Bacteriovoracaceae bacterium]|jgi:hypothetical protein|nr:hypothetical protein [Bacteriovoracaceae bacterium]